MSRAEKRDFLREQRAIARSRKPKEEASEEDIAISIKSSKSTSSSQFGSHENESAFLQITRTKYDLMGQLMTDMGVSMDVNLKYFLKVQLSISQEIIDCLTILLMTDVMTMMDFAKIGRAHV